jgi:hypothetical protein
MKTGQTLYLGILVFFACNTEGKNFYVRPDGGSYGRENGSDWNNAFDGMPPSDHGFWRSLVQPGDIIYVAGGTYHSNWQIKKSGAPGRAITIKRATASEHGTDTGWNDAFDNQVLLQQAGISTYACDYITIDGAVRNGIKILPAEIDNNRVIYLSPRNANGSNHIVLRYIEVAGPGVSRNEIRAIANTPTKGGATGCLIEYCTLHDVASAIFLADVSDVIIQHCTIYNLNADGPHENVVWSDRSSNVIFRWNVVYNSVAEGVFLRAGNKSWDIYGNIFLDCGYGIATKAGYPNNDIRIYNNTFKNVKYPIYFKDASNTGIVKNNLIYTRTGKPIISYQDVVHDYNWYSGYYTYGEANGIAGGDQDPFVNAAQDDYRLRPGTSAIDKGANLGAAYDTGFDGIRRFKSGAWDIGAYEYVDGDSAANPPRNIRVSR